MRRSFAAVFACACLAACGKQPAAAPVRDDHAPPKTNRIDVPEAVRKNLGIAFAQVERRAVAATLRLPGTVELLPNGRTEVRPPLPGRISVRVQPLQRVAAGDLLATVASPQWRAQQRELGELANALAVTEANRKAMPLLLSACEQHEASLRAAADALQGLVRTLEASQQQVGGQATRLAEARAELAANAAQMAEAHEKHAETQTRQIELEATALAQRDRLRLALAAAATTLDVPVATLTAAGPDGAPGWQAIDTIELRAPRAGVVETIAGADGALVDAHDVWATIIDPTAVRCRVRALQSDLGRLRDGLPTAIVPAGAADPALRVAAELQLATGGDAAQRTFDLCATPRQPVGFLRPGVAVFVEITTLGTAAEVLAIPRAAVLQDGLQRVFFRRDPKDKDKVIRVEADLGVDDGRWVEVKSDLMDGDEVVTAGAYELVLASSAQATKGGHFHADGTWHEDHE
jgi:multidrug resistance efflux pump